MNAFGGQIRGLARRERLSADLALPTAGEVRGSAIGRVCRQQNAAGLQRRVIVKVRCVSHGGTGTGRLGDHLRYLHRDGVSRQCGPGSFYGGADTMVDPCLYRLSCRNDPHHFRILVSAEDADCLIGLATFVRDLMARVESDLGTGLDWLAVDHYNTGLPHTHIVLRGRVRDGGALIIAPAYLRHGLRARARELVDRELGPAGSARSATRDRARCLSWTASDQCLAGLAQGGRLALTDMPELAAEAGCGLVRRLRSISRLGLARERLPGVFLLARDFGETLRSLEERGLLMAVLQRELERAGLDKAPGERVLWRPGAGERRVVGEVVAVTNRTQAPVACLVLDATDRRTYLVPLPGVAAPRDTLAKGMIVSLAMAEAGEPASRLRLAIRSYLRLEGLVASNHPTWLDQLIDGGCRQAAPGTGFAERVSQSLGDRRAFLERRGVLRQGVAMPPNLYRWLRGRSLEQIAERLGERLGLDFCPPRAGVRVSGRIVGTLALPSERLAIVAGARRFTLVTWTPAFDRYRDKRMTLMIGPSGLGLSSGLGLGPALAGH